MRPRSAALFPGPRAVCRFCVWPALPGPVCRLPAMRLCVRGFCCRCLACLARRAGAQGGAAARRLRVRLPADAPAFRSFVFDLRPACASYCLLLLRGLSPPLSVCPPCGFVCAHLCFYLLPFFCLTFASQNSFHLSLMPRRAPHFLFGKKMGEKNREGALPRPLRTPIPAPCGQSFSLPRCWPAYAALWAANRRLTGKRLKSQGAELSFSSVSVRRRTPAP